MSKSTFKKLSHTMYECKYHIVFCPKYRHRILKDEIADYCRREFFRLAKMKDLVEVLEHQEEALRNGGFGDWLG